MGTTPAESGGAVTIELPGSAVMGFWSKVGERVTESKEDREARADRVLRPLNARMDRMNAKEDKRDRDAGKPVGKRDYFLPENFAGLTYTDATISLDGDERSLAGVTVEVESTGSINRRITATRAGVGFVLAGPVGALAGAAARKRQDDRDIVMLVDAPDFQWILPIHPKGVAAARAYAARVNTAARAISAASA